MNTKQTKRLDALTLWAGRVRAGGWLTPTEGELADIAGEPDGWGGRHSTEVLRFWAPVIDHILHQLKFGVSPEAAVDQIPNGLLTGTPPSAVAAAPPPVVHEHNTVPTPMPTTTTTGQPPAVEALMRWRTARINEGAEGADLIKDVTLKNLVKFGHSDAEQISKKLPGPAAYLGPQIAAIIAEFSGGAPPSVQKPPPPPVERTAPTPRVDVAVPPPGPPTVQVTPPRHAAAPSPPAAEALLARLTQADFAEYEYGDSDHEPGPITIKTTDDGVRLAFEPFTGQRGKLVLYRVVSGDDFDPYKPEAGDLVGVTTALEVYDNRYLAAAVRHYQVWCHVGVDHEGARRSQPFLLARGQEISPVDDFAISEEDGRVIGQWKVYSGTRAVRVFRVPLDGSGSRPDDPRNQICVDQPNLTGFVDDTVARGSRYLYRVVAEVSVAGASRWSRPKQHDVLVSVVLTPVTDLMASLAGDGARMELTWSTPPVGTVRVYRSPSPPPPGMDGSEMPEASLQVQGFTEEARIKDPVTAAERGSRITGVPWPAAWDRVYLTPVTVLGGQARIGVTQVHTRPLPPVTDPELIERYDTEIVTFGWPRGAASVLAYVGSTTLSPEEICTRNMPVAELSESQYRRDGGLYFARRLEPKGCTVCLVPVNYSRGEQVRGEITVLNYPGLHRMRYKLIPREVPGRHIRQLVLRSELDIDAPIALVMRNRIDRLPLSADDGELIYFTPVGGGDRRPQALIEQAPKGEFATAWSVDWTDHRGYFRVFIAQVADRTRKHALADPEPIQLFLSPNVGPPE